MTSFWVVRFGAYSMGIEISGSQPDAPYFHNWLSEQVAAGKLVGNSQEQAQRLAALVRDRWAGRAFWVEVMRADRLGSARIEYAPPPAPVKH